MEHENRSVTLNLLTTPSLKAILKDKAKGKGTSLNNLINAVLEEYLGFEDEKEQAVDQRIKELEQKKKTAPASKTIKELRPDLTLYSLKEVAELLGITSRTVWTYIRKGKLDAVKVGNQWKVTEDGIKAFFKQSSHK